MEFGASWAGGRCPCHGSDFLEAPPNPNQAVTPASLLWRCKAGPKHWFVHRVSSQSCKLSLSEPPKTAQHQGQSPPKTPQQFWMVLLELSPFHAARSAPGDTRAVPSRTLTTNMYCCADLAVNSGLHSPMHRSTGPELIPGSACPISQTILEAEMPQGSFGRRCQQCPAQLLTAFISPFSPPLLFNFDICLFGRS